MLLQKRSREKDAFPGCYDISSAGHIPAGDGFVESALRELEEELGIRAEPSELVRIGLCDTGWIRNFMAVLFATGRSVLYLSVRSRCSGRIFIYRGKRWKRSAG